MQEERITRTVARSFAPEFSHTMDFPCNLIWTEADNEALSLAEILERGQLHLQVWHQVPGLASGEFLIPLQCTQLWDLQNIHVHIFRVTCDFNHFLCVIIWVFVMQMFELAFFRYWQTDDVRRYNQRQKTWWCVAWHLWSTTVNCINSQDW